MADEQQFVAGVNTHENVIFSCFGGASNTGITSELACLEAVKELGLTKAAKKIITVDGCPFECAHKVVEQAGFKPVKSIVLTRDINMKKKGLSEDIGKEIKGVMEYISDAEIKQAKELIVKNIME